MLPLAHSARRTPGTARRRRSHRPWPPGRTGSARGWRRRPPGQAPGRHVGVHEPGRHRGHRDAMRGQVPGQRLAERVQPRLARPVGRLPGLTAERAAGRHVHDAAAAALDHVPHRAPGHVGRTGEVDGQRLLPGRLPLLVGHLGDPVRGVDARRCSPARPGHPARWPPRPPSGAPPPASARSACTATCPAPGRLASTSAARPADWREGSDPVALFREGLRHRLADAPAGPGDQHCPPIHPPASPFPRPPRTPRTGERGELCPTRGAQSPR